MSWPFSLFIGSLVLCLSSLAQAEFRSRNDIGLGFTTNANLEDRDPKSDFFARLVTNNVFTQANNRLGLKLGYQDYFAQNESDVFSWRLSDTYSPRANGWSYTGALSGQQYPGGAPATTDVSFNNVGLEVSAEKSVLLTAASEFAFGPGFQIRRYGSDGGRTDPTLFGVADLSFDPRGPFEWGVRTELGFVFSSDADYSRAYFEVGGDGGYRLNDSWKLRGDLTLRYSSFFNRTVSETTVTTRARGKLVTSVRDEMEAYSLVTLGIEAMKTLSESKSIGMALTHSQQTSRSGYQDYAATDLLARFIFTF
jgi:hypothetical protein